MAAIAKADGNVPNTLPTPIDNTTSPIHIDGSVLEGGGQILRNAFTACCLMRRSVVVDNIRATRPKPGLGAQHAEGLGLITRMCRGLLHGGEQGSQRVEFTPGTLRAGLYEAKPRTAGSIALLLQISLPCIVFAKHALGEESVHQGGGRGTAGACQDHARGRGRCDRRQMNKIYEPGGNHGRLGDGSAHRDLGGRGLLEGTLMGMAGGVSAAAGDSKQLDLHYSDQAKEHQVTTRLRLEGGTNAEFAPQIDYVEHVLLPLLSQHMGIVVDLKVQRRGYFPKGQGVVNVCALHKATPLNPITLMRRGNVTEIRAYIVASKCAVGDPERAASAVARQLQLSPFASIVLTPHILIDDRAAGKGGGVLLVAHTDTGCILAADRLAQQGKTHLDLGDAGSDAARELAALLVTPQDSSAVGNELPCVDDYMQDQLIIFMALAVGPFLCCIFACVHF